MHGYLKMILLGVLACERNPLSTGLVAVHNRRLGVDVPAGNAVWSGSPFELLCQLVEQTTDGE